MIVTEFEGWLTFLQSRGGDRAVRQYAVWVARQTAPTNSSHRSLLRNIEDACVAESSPLPICADLRKSFSSTAMAAQAVGISHGSHSAASFLACYACTCESARDAASEALRWTMEWYKLVMGTEHQDYFRQHLVDKMMRMFQNGGWSLN